VSTAWVQAITALNVFQAAATKVLSHLDILFVAGTMLAFT
jgi:hypothetical protein